MTLTSWLARHRYVVVGVTTAAGVALIAWAFFVDGSWGQGLLINAGTAFLLLVPLFLVQQAMDRSIRELKSTVVRSVDGYGAIRALLPKGERRTAVMNTFLAAVRHEAEAGNLPLSEIRLAAAGESTGRTVALAVMCSDVRYLDADLVRRSTIESENGNEQYWAMRAAQKRWDELPDGVRRAVLGYLRDEDRVAATMAHDSDRWAVRERILSEAGVADP